MALSFFKKKPEAAPAVATSTLETLKARYKELCDTRDRMNESLVSLQQQLTDANTREQAARNDAMALAAKINELRGPGWVAMKKEIGLLAAALSGKH